ncbi:MAG: arginine deiminase family protein [Bacteroidota bacterium]
MFTKAIVRTPCTSFINGLTSANLGRPDYKLALKQHQEYINALNTSGVEVIVLPPDEKFPDSTFVEDTALLTPHCAIITSPGAPSRKGEVIQMKEVVKEYYSNIEEIEAPGTVEAGDIMMVKDHYYIGLSERTNLKGAEQTINILQKYGMNGSVIEVDKGLHLKSSVAYLENNNLVATKDFSTLKEFKKFKIIEIPDEESYAANCIWINDKVIIPKGYPRAKQKILDAGCWIQEVDVSEFRKLDGGLSCLSLRF